MNTQRSLIYKDLFSKAMYSSFLGTITALLLVELASQWVSSPLMAGIPIGFGIGLIFFISIFNK